MSTNLNVPNYVCMHVILNSVTKLSSIEKFQSLIRILSESLIVQSLKRVFVPDMNRFTSLLLLHCLQSYTATLYSYICMCYIRRMIICCSQKIIGIIGKSAKNYHFCQCLDRCWNIQTSSSTLQLICSRYSMTKHLYRQPKHLVTFNMQFDFAKVHLDISCLTLVLIGC